ncbi:MAG: beta strand repeat-containing protein, partial [Hyphomicrobiales bacterium]
MIFANQNLNTTSAAQSVTLTNSGTGTLTITSIVPSAQYAQTNTCGASVAPAANCSINVTFTPTATGAQPGTITVTDNATGSPHTVTLSGTGVAPAVSFSPASLIFANQNLNTTSAAQSVTLTNSGTATLTLTSIVASAQYAQTNTCGASVAPAANCSINVTFTPTVVGSDPGTITVTDSASGSPQTISLTGTGVAPAISFSPTSLSFGNQTQNTTSASQAVTLTNTGSAALTITSVLASAQYAQTNTCGASVAPAANCSISVTFTPTATGSQPGTITVTDNATGSPHTIALSGTGTAPLVPAVSLSATSLTFGSPAIAFVQDAGATGSGSTTLAVAFASNVTQNNLIVVGVSSSASNSFAATPITDTRGSSWSLAVTRNPGTTGTPALAAIYYAVVPSTGPDTVTVHMTGTNNLHLHIYEVSGLVTSSVLDKTGSNYQTGATAATVSTSAATTAANEFVFAYFGKNNGSGTWTAGTGYGNTKASPNTGSATDAFSEDKIISATGTQTATATASASDGLTSVIATFIAGPGGTTVGSTSAAKTVTLTDTGTGALSISSIVPSGDYGQTNTCGSFVAAAGNCTISVTFTPTATGTRTGTIAVTDNATGSPQTVTLTGTGTPAAGPVVSLSTASLSFGNQPLNTPSAAQIVTLTNPGIATLSITSIVASAQYAQTNTCGASVAVGANCTISVTFTPTATGSQPGTITITDNAT